jgi:hypothetical protein
VTKNSMQLKMNLNLVKISETVMFKRMTSNRGRVSPRGSFPQLLKMKMYVFILRKPWDP